MTDHGPGPHRNVARVQEAAAAAGLEIAVTRFPEGTRTAEDAARAVGCGVGQIVKSLVFMADEQPVLALVSGSNRLDPARLGAAVRAERVRRATGDEARTATGYAIGGVPPIGHRPGLAVLMDRSLLDHESVWAAAGLPDAVFEVEPHRLAEAASALVTDLAADD